MTTARRILVHGCQLGLGALILLCWEYLPRIDALASKSPIFDPFFVSSPSRIAHRLDRLFTEGGAQSIWPFLWPTMQASVIGLCIGTLAGIGAGLLLGSWAFLSTVIRPFLVAFNAVPRIALIPIIVIIFGTTLTASVLVSVIVVFFIVFFNAYEGALSPPRAQMDNARLLGASHLQVTTRIRFWYVVAWTLAALPAAATFSVLAVVTGEILTGYAGLGRLLSIGQSTADSTLTFAVVIVLSVLGLAVVGLSELLRGRLMHWWVGGRSS